MAILTPYQVDPSLLANSYSAGAKLGTQTPNLATSILEGANTGYQTSLNNEATIARTEVFKQQSAQVAVENAFKVKELENYDLNKKIEQDYTNAQTLKINSDRKLNEIKYKEALAQESEYNSFISQLEQYKNTDNVKGGANLLTSQLGMKFAQENSTGYKALMKSFQAMASQSGDSKALATLGGVETNIQNKKDVAQYNSLKDARDILDSQLNRDNILPGGISIAVNKEPLLLSSESINKLNTIPKEARSSFFDSDKVKVSTTNAAIRITSLADENSFLEIPRANSQENPLENPDYQVFSNIWNQEDQRKVLGGRLKLVPPKTTGLGKDTKPSKELQAILQKEEELRLRNINYAEGLKKRTVEKDTLFSRMGITNPTKTEIVGDNFKSVVSKGFGLDVKRLDKGFPQRSPWWNRGESPLTGLKRSVETGTPLDINTLGGLRERLLETEYDRVSKTSPELLKGMTYEDFKDTASPEIDQRIQFFLEDAQAEFKGSPPLKESLEKSEANIKIQDVIQKNFNAFREQKEIVSKRDSFYLKDVGDILRKVESSSIGDKINYSARSASGLAVGAYQFQPIRLKELGVLKSITKGGRVSDLENPENWEIEGGLDTFLKNGNFQDSLYIRHMEKNRQDLERLKIVDKNTPPNILRGMLMSKHLMTTKANKFLKELQKAKYNFAKVPEEYVGVDGNDTSLLEYFLVGSQNMELATAKEFVEFFRGG